MKCYARFKDGKWYLGTVAHINGSGKDKTYDVSEGGELVLVRRLEVLSLTARALCFSGLI